MPRARRTCGHITRDDDGARVCPALAGPDGFCDPHRQLRGAQRGSSTARGYDAKHEKIRARLLPRAYGTACPLCDELMVRGDDLHLDHSRRLVDDPTARGDRIVHAYCNNSRDKTVTPIFP